MQIKMLRDRRRFRVGEVHELPDGVANVLIRRGFAEVYVEPVIVKRNKKPPHRRLVVNA